MSFYRSVILILLSLLFVVNATAQDNRYVYKDTSIVDADSVETNVVVADNSGDEAVETAAIVYADTSLRYNQLTLERDSVEALKKLKALAYAKNLDSLLYQYQKGRKVEESEAKSSGSWLSNFFGSALTQYFFWLLAGVFIIFILYKLFFTQGFFQRSYAKAKVLETVDEREALSAETDFSKLIAQALGNKNYRLAIRYHYLQLLQKLTQKGIIEFTPDKTNYEYVTELSGKSYKKDFAAITLHYEYAWYGEFEIDEQTFGAIQNKFKQLNNLL
ncbi:MAG: DUF4129 domain-containing protein [Ferruginibacter sp.]